MLHYLERQLSSEEIAWFEAYALDKPDLLHAIDADCNLRDGIAAAQAAFASPNVAPVDDSASPELRQRAQVNQRPRARAFRAQRWLSIAASLVVGVGAGVLLMRATTSHPTAASEVVVNPSRVIYDTVRGVSDRVRLEHADSHSTYAFIEVAVPPGAKSIVLKIQGLPDRELTPSADGFVSFLLPRHDERNAPVQVAYAINGTTHTRNIESVKPIDSSD